MTSQLDLDQGGTFREWVRTFMGPSVGWVMAPARNVLTITAAGTYAVLNSTTLILVNTIAAVVIELPSALNPTVPAGAQPGPYVTIEATAGYVMVFNSPTVPADGAVAPIECIQAPANTTNFLSGALTAPAFSAFGTASGNVVAS